MNELDRKPFERWLQRNNEKIKKIKEDEKMQKEKMNLFYVGADETAFTPLMGFTLEGVGVTDDEDNVTLEFKDGRGNGVTLLYNGRELYTSLPYEVDCYGNKVE